METMILITGATGTNGRELIQQLTSSGQRVRAMVRDPKKAAELEGDNVEIVAGDFAKPATVEAALKGADKAFLLAPVAKDFAAWQRTFISAAQHAKLRHVVKFSGLGATRDSGSEIMRMHAETDELLRKSGVPFTILQPNSFYQNLFWSAPTIKSQGAFFLPLKQAQQSLVDVRDIGSVAAKVLTASGHEGKTYTLTGPESLTLSKVAEKLSTVLARKINYVDVPAETARQAMSQEGMPEWNVRALVELYGVFATGAYSELTDTIPKLLGRSAISFDQFARDYRQMFPAQ